jgi:hypothetical protein
VAATIAELAHGEEVGLHTTKERMVKERHGRTHVLGRPTTMGKTAEEQGRLLMRSGSRLAGSREGDAPWMGLPGAGRWYTAGGGRMAV